MLEVKSDEMAGQAVGTIMIVSGLASAPDITRSSCDSLSIFVNHRWVSNRMLAFALEEAYHGLLMQGKHPIAVINLQISPELIDVNVHPAKSEIKFQDERAVFAVLQRSVRAAVPSSPVPRLEESRPSIKLPIGHFNTSPQPPSQIRDMLPSLSPIIPRLLLLFLYRFYGFWGK